MKKNQNPGKDKIGDLRNLFLETIALVDKYLGDKAFSNFGEKKGKWASLSNRSTYDAEMLAFSDFVGKNITITSDEFVENLEKLMVNLEFRKSLHSQAGGKMIEKRVAEIKKLSLIQKFNMEGGKSRILDVLNAFTGREGEPKNESESYTLKAMWLMMLSEFEASVKQKAENYIDEIKKKISLIYTYVC